MFYEIFLTPKRSYSLQNALTSTSVNVGGVIMQINENHMTVKLTHIENLTPQVSYNI